MQGAARKGCQGVPGTCMCVMFMLEWLVPSHIQYIKRYQKISKDTCLAFHWSTKHRCCTKIHSCPWPLLTFCMVSGCQDPFPPCRHSRWNGGHRCQRPMSQTFHALPANEPRWPTQVVQTSTWLQTQFLFKLQGTVQSQKHGTRPSTCNKGTCCTGHSRNLE